MIQGPGEKPSAQRRHPPPRRCRKGSAHGGGAQSSRLRNTNCKPLQSRDYPSPNGLIEVSAWERVDLSARSHRVAGTPICFLSQSRIAFFPVGASYPWLRSCAQGLYCLDGPPESADALSAGLATHAVSAAGFRFACDASSRHGGTTSFDPRRLRARSAGATAGGLAPDD